MTSYGLHAPSLNYWINLALVATYVLKFFDLTLLLTMQCMLVKLNE